MAGPLASVFTQAAIGAVEKGIDFVTNPQRTLDQIQNAPRNMFGG